MRVDRSPFKILSFLPFSVWILQAVYIPFVAIPGSSGLFFPFAFFALLVSFFWIGEENSRLPKWFFFLPALCFLLILISLNAKIFSDSIYYSGFIVLSLFFIACAWNVSSRDPEEYFKKLIKAFASLGVFSSILGLYQFLDYKILGQAREVLIPYLLPPTSGARVSGIYGQPNLFALLLSISILSLFYYHIHLEKFSKNSFFYYIKYIPLILVSTVFFLTGSKNGVLSITICFIFIIYLFSKGIYDFKKFGKKYTILLSIFLFSFFIFKFINSFGVDVSSFGGRSFSNDQRIIFWLSSILIFLDNPFLGVGLGNFKYALSDYQNKALEIINFEFESLGYTRWAHNESFQLIAEGGIVLFAIYLMLIVGFFFYFFKLATGKEKNKPQFLYSGLFIMPFLFQSQLSWPLRYLPLFSVFLLILASFLSCVSLDGWRPSRFTRKIFQFLVLFALLIIIYFFTIEIKLGELRGKISRNAPIEEVFPIFSDLANNPYARYFSLVEFLPKLNYSVTREKNEIFAKKLIPFAEVIVEIEGSYWEWLQLGHLYFTAGLIAEAKIAVQEAIDRNPLYEPAWSMLHYLNMVQASNDTGKPLDFFFPKRGDSKFKIPAWIDYGNHSSENQ